MKMVSACTKMHELSAEGITSEGEGCHWLCTVVVMVVMGMVVVGMVVVVVAVVAVILMMVMMT